MAAPPMSPSISARRASTVSHQRHGVRVGGHDQPVQRPRRALSLELRLVEEGQGPFAGLVAGCGSMVDRRSGTCPAGSPAGPWTAGGQARVRYSPVRVSTLIFSPGFTKRGTWRTRPVSTRGRLAGAGHPVALDARARCRSR